ncbi:MAG: DUF2169 domain-containing protein [Desulfatitalea sp.]|nr:DUF2169 domain-containing protein [Desulfatitalea sp.]NNJ99385.1 DUF2169 domain-containing protein [Desulfatitalea sp.]
MKLENLTPFESERYAISDKEGKDLLLIVVKATYEFDPHGVLTIAARPHPIEMADIYCGAPDETSIKYASDFSFAKIATDIALSGHAYALSPNRKESYVLLKVGMRQHLVKVFGDRIWKKRLGFFIKSSPRPFEKIPIVYERAFGGYDRSNKSPEKHAYEARNPVGVGFISKKGNLPKQESPLPNFEDPNALINSITDRPAPAGFGFIAPSWQPRMTYAGTYDKAWRETTMPLLPDDFDPRFFNAANPSLVYPGFLNGDEPVEIAGASRLGTIRFDLPGIRPQCVIQGAEEETVVQMNLDKLYFNMDEDQVVLVWSGNYPVQGELRDIDGVRVST